MVASPAAAEKLDLQTAFDRGFEAVKAYVDDEFGRLAARVAVIEMQKGSGVNGLSEPVLKALAKGLVPFVREVLGETVTPLKERIADLEARPALEDGGVWDATKVYRAGQVVSHDGSAFVCKQAHVGGKPGASDSWRLMIKRGRDGKDAR